MEKADKEILDGFKNKLARSPLAPYRELILKLRQRGATLREIAQLLSERNQQPVSHVAVHRFLARLEKERSKSSGKKQRKKRTSEQLQLPSPPTSPPLALPVKREVPNEVRQRIEALKQRKTNTDSSEADFHFDPEKPLTLIAENEKK
jgi:DNA-binding transcriptional MerR regulator